MRPHMLVIILVLALLTVGLTMFLIVSATKPAGTLPDRGVVTLPDNPYAEFFVPDFNLIDRQGNPITHAELDGRYTVLDFFFTSCPLWCPGMSTAMAQVQRETAGTKARLMSISIDGQNDTPAIINRYANDYGADPARWKFATGDPAVVASIVRDGLKFEIGDESLTADGVRNIDHPTRLILVGPDRRVVGLYRYDDPEDIRALIQRVRELAR
jgi:cytochrome oxidase Cu insertion factor (SCO1/SenC/PrrC family)